MKTFIASIIISVLAPLYALCQESPDSAACRRKFDEALKMREDYEFDKAAAILENLKASCGNDSCIMLKADSLLLQAKNGKSMIEFASSPVTVASTDVPACARATTCRPCRPSRRLRRRTPPPASPLGPWRPWPVPGAAAASGATGISATPADCPSSMKTRNFKLFKARQTPGFIFLPPFGQPMENPHEKAATP